MFQIYIYEEKKIKKSQKLYKLQDFTILIINFSLPNNISYLCYWFFNNNEIQNMMENIIILVYLHIISISINKLHVLDNLVTHII